MPSALLCDFHAHPEARVCVDCGINPWLMPEGGRIAHEDFYVSDELWDEVCPDDTVWVMRGGEVVRIGRFVICLGCFEARLGRRLTREDFITPPRRQWGLPPSYRFRRRWKGPRR